MNSILLKKLNKSYYIFGLIVILFLAFILKPQNTSSTDVYTKLTKGNFTVSVTTTGELQAENSVNITAPEEVKSPVWGGFSNLKIQDIVPEGTIVKAGDYVALFDRSEVANRIIDIDKEIKKTENEITKKKNDSSLAFRELRNDLINKAYTIDDKRLAFAQLLYEPAATIKQAKSDIEKMIRELAQDRINYSYKVEQFKSEIEDLKMVLMQHKNNRQKITDLIEKYEIKAPQNGMVIYFKEWGGQKRKVGSVLNAWDLIVATLPDMSAMISKTYVNEIEISKIKIGLMVWVSLDAFPDKQYKGQIVSVANVGEQLAGSTSKMFEVNVRLLQKSAEMRPGMTTSNKIIAQEYSNVNYIAIDAVTKIDTAYFVYTSNGLKKQVICGNSNDNFIIILKGINATDNIFLNQPENAQKFNIRYLD